MARLHILQTEGTPKIPAGVKIIHNLGSKTIMTRSFEVITGDKVVVEGEKSALKEWLYNRCFWLGDGEQYNFVRAEEVL